MNSKSQPNNFLDPLEKIIMKGPEEIHFINGSWVSKDGKIKRLTNLGSVSMTFQNTYSFSPMDVFIDNLNLGEDLADLPICAYNLTIDEENGLLYARFNLFKKYSPHDYKKYDPND
ncbi:hypothetical protein C0585_05780 [Candidatus Woesearchaeota archaeon]|nr:MAG: hypothetical protein C0585_05780 [Candidatus Woesearchaeota archaeon]